jgi:hypothetical protein
MKLICKFCKKEFLAKYKKQTFCSSICSNRYNLNNKKNVSLPIKYTPELAEFFGILLGDGSVTQYYTKVYLNLIADDGYDKRIISLIKKIFPKIKICIMERPKRGTREIQISSRQVSDYFIKIGFYPKIRSIPKWISKNKLFTEYAIRGLFDTEGSIGMKKFNSKNGIVLYKQLTFTNKNKPLLEFIEHSLCKFGYSPTKNSKSNIYISNKKDIDRYFKEIGTSNPKLEKSTK